MLSHKRKRELVEKIIFGLIHFFSWSIVAILLIIFGFVFLKGAKTLSWEFLTDIPREGMIKGGIFPAIVGTLYLTVLSMLFAAPIGILSGIYMAEYAKNKRIKYIIDLMTNNLAGIPSIVFGLFGMALFVLSLNFGDSILSGSLTLAILTLPVIIRATEEAFKDIPNSLREASLSLGATKLQTIFYVVLPVAMPRIITGVILSLGRVAGETAPILFTVAAYYLPKVATSVWDPTMALPYHLYVISTSGTDLEKAQPVAFGTALVLLAIVLFFNLIATYIRNRYAKKHGGK